MNSITYKLKSMLLRLGAVITGLFMYIGTSVTAFAAETLPYEEKDTMALMIILGGALIIIIAVVIAIVISVVGSVASVVDDEEEE